MRLEVVGHISAHEHRLRRKVHFRLHAGTLVEALLLRLAHEQLARVELVAHRSPELWCVRLALGGPLLEHEFEKPRWVQILALRRRIGFGRCLLRGLLRERGGWGKEKRGGGQRGEHSEKHLHDRPLRVPDRVRSILQAPTP